MALYVGRVPQGSGCYRQTCRMEARGCDGFGLLSIYETVWFQCQIIMLQLYSLTNVWKTCELPVCWLSTNPPRYWIYRLILKQGLNCPEQRTSSEKDLSLNCCNFCFFSKTGRKDKILWMQYRSDSSLIRYHVKCWIVTSLGLTNKTR